MTDLKPLVKCKFQKEQAGRRLVRSLLTVCDMGFSCIHGPMSIISKQNQLVHYRIFSSLC